MRADYDSQHDTLEITLRDVERLGRGSKHGAAVVHVGSAGGAPAIIDVLSSRELDDTLATIAELYGLDRDALLAVARAAIAAPDRAVTVEVGARARL